MLRLFRTITLSVLAGLGLAASLPASASAEGLYLGFGDDGASVGLYSADSGRRGWDRGDEWDHRREWRHERRDDRRRESWRRDRGPRCTPERALDKAERLGLRRVRLSDIDRDTIRVSGRRHGERFTVTFARAPSCPVVRF